MVVVADAKCPGAGKTRVQTFALPAETPKPFPCITFWTLVVDTCGLGPGLRPGGIDIRTCNTPSPGTTAIRYLAGFPLKFVRCSAGWLGASQAASLSVNCNGDQGGACIDKVNAVASFGEGLFAEVERHSTTASTPYSPGEIGFSDVSEYSVISHYNVATGEQSFLSLISGQQTFIFDEVPYPIDDPDPIPVCVQVYVYSGSQTSHASWVAKSTCSMSQECPR